MRLHDGLIGRVPLRGVVLKMPCPAEVELAGHSGFDFVVVDTEHGPSSGVELEHHLRAADAAGIEALVRVPQLDAAAIGAALDAGAAGVVVPHVSRPEQAHAAVRAARYPPDGCRGMARSTRAGRYASTSPVEHLDRAAGTCVVVQIEDLEGAERAGEIAAVEGVDALFPGAVDIAATLGVAEPAGDPRVADAVARVLAAAAEAGIAAIAVAGSQADATGLEMRGATATVFVGSGLVADAFRTAVARRPATGDEALADVPLVLLPGMLGGDKLWEAFLAASRTEWSPQFGRIDLDDSVAEMAESVLAVAPERFVLAGHSLGGIVALEILRRAPQRIAACLLVSTSARPPTDEQRRAWELLADRVGAGEFADIVNAQPDLLLGGSNAARTELREVVREMAGAVGAAGFLRQLQAQQVRADLRSMLAEVAAPMLVISCDEDTVCPPELQEEIASAIPGAHLATVAGAGHLGPLEDPRAFAQLVDEWARLS